MRLLNARAACALEIGRVKKRARAGDLPAGARGGGARATSSESTAGPLDDDAIRRLFERIIDEARRLERIADEAKTSARTA